MTNFSGGVQGGISNGEPIIFRVAFKPPATIGQAQATADFSGNETTLEAKGRHDPCVVPRAVPIVESMAALVIADLALRQRSSDEGVQEMLGFSIALIVEKGILVKAIFNAVSFENLGIIGNY